MKRIQNAISFEMEFTSRTRQDLEDREENVLAPFACKSRNTNSTRLHEEKEDPYRTNFQRDRDRIIHSRAFRRLKHKRQVFLITTGDHYRTRLTHTLEVVQLSRSISRALGLNEDLTEAIALGHDLGHTPFGHIGEIAIHRILNGSDDLDGEIVIRNYGGFKHNYQSVRVVDSLEKKYYFDGLNLTQPVREGILKHTSLRQESIRYPGLDGTDLRMELPHATTLEGQVVGICDEIAQRTHDLEDGLRARFVSVEDVRQLSIVKLAESKFEFSRESEDLDFIYIGRLIKKLINLFVTDVIETTIRALKSFYQKKLRLHPFDESIVTFGPEVDPIQNELDQFIDRKIIHRPGIDWADDMSVYVIRGLFRAFLRNPHEMRSFPTHKYFSRYIKWQSNQDEAKSVYREDQNFLRLVADYIAGMTDHFAMKEYERLLGAS